MKYVHTDANIKYDSKVLRLLVGVFLPIFGLSLLGLLWFYDPTHSTGKTFSLFCPFNKITGLYCPGCGMTRSAYELLKLNIIGALRDNALVILFLGPLAAYLCFKDYVNYVLGRKILHFPQIKNWMIAVLVAIILLFTILRNIPVFPFIYLMPIPPS